MRCALSSTKCVAQPIISFNLAHTVLLKVLLHVTSARQHYPELGGAHTCSCEADIGISLRGSISQKYQVVAEAPPQKTCLRLVMQYSFFTKCGCMLACCIRLQGVMMHAC